MARRRIDFGGTDQAYELRLRNGATVYLPWRTHETQEGDRRKTWRTLDWSGITDCERCGGYSRADTGACSSGAGLISAVMDKPGFSRVCLACDCAYGAWRNQMQRIPYLDDAIPDLAGVSGDDWAELMLHARAETLGDPIESNHAILVMRMSDGPAKRRLSAALSREATR